MGPQVTRALAGVAATGAVGTVGNAVSYALTGNQATGVAGSLIVVGDVTRALTGVQAAGTVGYLQALGAGADASDFWRYDVPAHSLAYGIPGSSWRIDLDAASMNIET